MTEKRFEQLVRELEGYAKSHPAQYKLNVALLAFAGYAYVLAVLSIVISLTIGCFVLIKNSSGAHALLFKVGLGFIILATVIVRALWVRLESPTGIEIQPRLSPSLDACCGNRSGHRSTNGTERRPLRPIPICTT